MKWLYAQDATVTEISHFCWPITILRKQPLMTSWNLTRRKNCARKRRTKKEREKRGKNSDKERRNKRTSKFFRINSKRTTMNKTRHVRRNNRKFNRSHPNLKKSLYLPNRNRNPSLQHSNPLISRVSSRTFSIP